MSYESTQVPEMKSWGEICKVLYSHGCEATRYTETPEGFIMEFIRASVTDGQKGKQLVRMPVSYDYSRCKTPNQREQEKRTKWRSLYYYVKAVFDAVDKGIVMVEQAFMADTVVSLPSGEQKRVIEAFLPQVSHGVLDVFALPSGQGD
ncbi:MAG: hypothetical protein M0R06_18505 [Sphaerochaeta sp.]|nr:hypothetical protein [Sphaerochaeta sp.]